MFKKLLAAILAFMAAAAFAAVDVNRADAAALDGVKGVGPGIASKILEERQKGGRFKDWNDLISRVSGIGEASAAKLSEGGLRVNGRTFSGAAAAPAKKDDKKADTKADSKADSKADTKAAAAPAPAPAAAAKDEKKAAAPVAAAKDEKKAEANKDAKADAKAEKKAGDTKKDTKPEAKAEKKDEKK
jgi:competence protein ComEA